MPVYTQVEIQIKVSLFIFPEVMRVFDVIFGVKCVQFVDVYEVVGVGSG